MRGLEDFISLTEEKGSVDSDESSALKQCYKISPDWSKGSVV